MITSESGIAVLPQSTTRWLRTWFVALLGALLLGCHELPLREASQPVAKPRPSQNAKPGASKKDPNARPPGDSIPDAAEIGLAPAES